jgi:hypothetical protein
MKARELKNLGIPTGTAIEVALKAVGLAHEAGQSAAAIRNTIKSVATSPEAYRDDAAFGDLARTLLGKPLDFVAFGPKGLVQPAVKCRGPEYLRIIYGPKYLAPGNLDNVASPGSAHWR